MWWGVYHQQNEIDENRCQYGKSMGTCDWSVWNYGGYILFYSTIQNMLVCYAQPTGRAIRIDAPALARSLMYLESVSVDSLHPSVFFRERITTLPHTRLLLDISHPSTGTLIAFMPL